MLRFLALSALLCSLFVPLRGFCDGNDPWENLKSLTQDSKEPIPINATFWDDNRAFSHIDRQGYIFFRTKSGALEQQQFYLQQVNMIFISY